MYQKITHLLNQKPKNPLNHLELATPPLKAAVLLLCYRDEGEDHILFTQRSEQVPHHKGQVSFPGGVVDPQDDSLWQTALRETYEEIGLSPQSISFMGELGPLVTPTGFHVTPFVGTINPPLIFNPNPVEIAEIFSVPVAHLLDSRHFTVETKIYFGKVYPDPVFTFHQYKIWGATGRILLDFLEVWKSVHPS